MSSGFDPHLSEIVRRRFNIEGNSGPDEFSPSIVGVVPLDCDAMSPEYSYYAKEMRQICWGFQGGVALQLTYAQVLNPATSNHLTIIKRIWGGAGFAAGDAVVGPVAAYRQDVAAGVAALPHCPSDCRWGPAPMQGPDTFSMGTAAVAGGTLHFTLPFLIQVGNASCTFDWKGDYVLSPGTGLTIWTRSIDIDLDVNFEIRTRMRTRWEQ